MCSALCVHRLVCAPRVCFSMSKGGGDGVNRTFGRPIGLLKVRRADKSAKPIGTPNPSAVKIRWAGGSICAVFTGPWTVTRFLFNA